MAKKLLFILIIFISLRAQALIIHVPADYPLIQTAILNSASGDTIEVAPGTYFENIDFRGRKVLLTSLFYLAKDTSYIRQTVINGSTPLHPDTASCVLFHSGEDSTAILQGFTITGGTGTKWTDIHGAGLYREGGGILIELCSPTIRYNIITNNKAINTVSVSGAGGGGMRIGDGNPIITNNLILSNQGRYGPGIVLNYTGCRVKNNIIAMNFGAVSFNGGSGIWINNNLGSTKKIIENNTIVNNSSNSAGAAIAILSATNVVLHNNIIWGNTPALQIKLVSSVPQITYCDIQGTYAGTGNINLNPQLDSICYSLSLASPCIDAGDTAVVNNDLTTAPGIALFPSLGTERNDMGAYGGPGAFLMQCTTNNIGINEMHRESFTVNVFPNPASKELFIEVNTGDKLSIDMYDINGRNVLSKTVSNKTSIDVKDLNEGIYTLTIKTTEGLINKKVVVLH